MSKCDDDIIFEAYLNKNKTIKEGFDFFDDEKSDKKIDNKTSLKTSSETKSFETPKSKMTEDEAKEFFINSDEFHQAFHNFMELTGYGEKEVDGKEMWCKCKKSKSVDEDEQQPIQTQQTGQENVQQQPVDQQNTGNIEQQKQEIINSLSQMTPEQISATYQAIFA